MARRLVPILSVAALLAACSHNSSTAGAAIEPAAPGNPSLDLGGAPGSPLSGDRLLLRGIALSEDQQQRITAIRSRYGVEMHHAGDESRRDREGSREKARALTEQRTNELRGVLTAEQQIQFDRNLAELRARMQ